jgi:N-(2-amino-2-carboxyethyl)-L-glutamate synthase
VPVISSPQDFNDDQVYVDLKSIFGRQLFLRREAVNFTGSIKLKAAKEMVEAAEQDGCLGPGSVLVESPSGNLGVARRCALHVRLGLRMIAASKGHEFIGVTDSGCNLTTSRLMEALGARVHTIIEPDPHGGFLEARINYVRALCASDERYVWPVRIVAVDSMGSVTFGGAPGPRMIPGLGTSVGSAQFDESFVDEVLLVEEADTVRACRRMARSGFLFGGCTGTVVSAAMQWLAEHGTLGITAVAIAPDNGERYLDTLYRDSWLEDQYGADVLGSIETVGSGAA